MLKYYSLILKDVLDTWSEDPYMLQLHLNSFITKTILIYHAHIQNKYIVSGTEYSTQKRLLNFRKTVLRYIILQNFF